MKTSNLTVKIIINSAKMLLNPTNVVIKFTNSFWECLPKNKKNIYIGYTTPTLSCRLTYHLSMNSIIKHSVLKLYNSTSQLTSSDVKKILTDNSKIISKNNNKTDYKSYKQYAYF